jgi:propanediol dehydratase large subunit
VTSQIDSPDETFIRIAVKVLNVDVEDHFLLAEGLDLQRSEEHMHMDVLEIAIPLGLVLG